MLNLHGFELIQESLIDEYQMVAKLFRHIRTGAQLLSIENDDEHKVFSINFKTVPKTSNGVAHILEHSVLNGSKKYPVKEPFIEIIKGSLQTFVNAFTYPDKTCYPCASQNLKDFYNLIDVYMDAVLHPLLKREVLDQEGWHYEMQNADDTLHIKGVVYNEMKGAYSDADDRLTDIALQNLFDESHPYHLDSGGNPEVIPELTYEEFIDFHQTYYHPSNALVYFYGNDPVEERLRIMNQYFEGYDSLHVDSSIPVQKLRNNPKMVKQFYATSNEDDGHYVTINYLLPEIETSFDAMKWSVLYYILFGTAASQLHKDLIDSELGDGLAGYGLESEMRQWSLSFGMKGVSAENADKVVLFIQESLKRIAKNGVDPEMIKAAMNSIEFSLRENNSGSYPRGLMLMLSALAFWNYEKDPIEAISFEAPLNQLKKTIAEDDQFFENLIAEDILANPHYVVVQLYPDADFEEKRNRSELEKFAEIKKNLNKQEIEKIIKNSSNLLKFQELSNSEEALATLPVLKLEDLSSDIRKIPTQKISDLECPVYWHDLDTNGVLYMSIGFNVRTIPQKLLPYFGIFSALLTQMGSSKIDFVRLIQKIGQETGGIYGSLFSGMKMDEDDFTTYYFVQGKTLVSQAKSLFDLLEELLLNPNLDIQERFLQVVLQMRVNLESMMVPYGHVMAQKRINGMITPSGWLTEITSGISYLRFLQDLEKRVKNDWENVQSDIALLWESLIIRDGMILNLTVGLDGWNKVKPFVKTFIEKIPQRKSEKAQWKIGLTVENEAFKIPAQVNYVGKGLNLKNAEIEKEGSLQVAARYLSNSYIWDQVRVIGGAYGGGAGLGQTSKTFSYQSYRDPNVFRTLKAYDGAGDFMRALELSESEVTKAIIATIASVDAPLMPDQKGHVALKWILQGITDEYRQTYRNEILSTTLDDMKALVAILDKVKEDGVMVVLGNQDSILESNKEYSKPLVIKDI